MSVIFKFLFQCILAVSFHVRSLSSLQSFLKIIANTRSLAISAADGKKLRCQRKNLLFLARKTGIGEFDR